MRLFRNIGPICFLLAGLAHAQILNAPKAPSVTTVPTPMSAIRRGEPGQVDLRFRITPGYHINSNTPKSEFLIPTSLKLDAPTDIVIGKITYPVGRDMAFPFSPDEKLSVYSGEFDIAVVVRPLHTVLPAKYMIRGQLKYQACDNAQCYPPKQLPVQFEVKVEKGKPVGTARRNPAQSPHAHR
jgi:hypothetical protein